MKTKTIELYKFRELPENIKAKVIENNRHINVEGGYWFDYDGKTDFDSKELKRMRLSPSDSDAVELLTWNNLYFDIYRGWYIQFDGAQFRNDEVARKFLGVPKELWSQIYWSFENKSYGGSSHSTTKLVYEPQAWDKEFTAKQLEIIERAVERFSDKMEEALKGLQSSYEYAVSDEAVIETIEANEYTFRADGKMENG